MSLEENKSIARRYPEEVYNQKKIDVLDAIMDKNIINHWWEPEVNGLQTIKEYISKNLVAFPDVKFIVEDQIAEGEKVVTRVSFTATHKGEFMGISPTDKKVKVTGVIIFKITKGKIVETWAEMDSLSWMRQLGVISMPS
jgi:predicted ester cyclase